MKKCRDEQAANHLFLPPRLLQLVQLTILARAVRRPDVLLKVDPSVAGDLDPPFTVLPEKDLAHQPLEDVLLEVFDLTASFMEARRVPDHLMGAAYRRAIGHTRDRNDLIRAARRNAAWTHKQDRQLVDFVNQRANMTDSTPVTLDAKRVELSREDQQKFAAIRNKQVQDIRIRIALLQLFNQRLEKCFSFIDLAADSDEYADDSIGEGESKSDSSKRRAGWSIGSKLRAIGHCVFTASKLPLINVRAPAITQFYPGGCPAVLTVRYVCGCVRVCACGSEQEAIEKTASTSRLSRVKLHRGRAILSKDRKQTTPATSECLFVQGARALNAKPSAYLRVPLDQQKEYLFPVGFVVFNSRGQDEDEAGLDWGGLYREAMNTMVDDLFDPDVLNLFIRVPNAASHAGGNQDTFVPNPKYNSPHAMQLFEFVGKLMGIAKRTRNFMPFRFPSIVWKPLVGQPVSREDLEGVDKVFYHYISNVMSSVANNDGTKYYFTVPRSDSVFVPLRSGGHRELVTADNVNEYIALAQRYRLREFKSQVGAMLHGLSQLVPARALRVLSWSELETQVCGVREVNLRLMKKHTHYVVYKETDAVVKVCTTSVCTPRCLTHPGPFRFATALLEGVGKLHPRRARAVPQVLLGTDTPTRRRPLGQHAQVQAVQTRQARHQRLDAAHGTHLLLRSRVASVQQRGCHAKAPADGDAFQHRLHRLPMIVASVKS